MIWRLLGLQKKLDSLFNDGWVNLGLSSDRSRRPAAFAQRPHA